MKSSIIAACLFASVVTACGDGDGGTDTAALPPVQNAPISMEGQLSFIEPGGNIAAAAANDDTIVLLQPGTYAGDFDLSARNVFIVGAWSPIQGAQSIIEGDVTVRGDGNRLRGVRVTGMLNASANNFSAAFCELTQAVITGGGISLIRNTFVAGQAAIPSHNAVLVGNVNLPSRPRSALE